MADSEASHQPAERKLLTVLFADLRGSLSLISGRDPEQADEILGAVTGPMQEAVLRHGGTLARLMGDGIMALFGAPNAAEHHAAHACMAALDMRRAVAEGRSALMHKLTGPIQIRIGLNSGEAVVKRVASGIFTGYEANGEVVHIAARMEQIAEENAILLTAETARLVAAHFDMRALSPLDIKGLSDKQQIFELLGERSGGRALQRGAPGSFVSRGQETALLATARRAAMAGNGQVVLIRGDAGLGKSRLVAEAILRQPDGCRVASAQGRPFRPRGYQLVAELVASCLGLETMNASTVDPAVLRANLAAMDASDLFAPLAVVLGLPISDPAIGDPAWRGLTPTERRNRMQSAVCALIEHVAARQTLVLVAEDLHWIDPESQDVLDRIVERLPQRPILLVATCRPEPSGAGWYERWRQTAGLQVVQLEPLPERALSGMLAARLHGPRAAELAGALARRAAGNPLFAEVMLAGLVDDGVLLNLGWQFHILRATSPDQLPATIRGLLSERVDRLAAQEKHVLRAASVVGPRTTMRLLASVSGLARDALAAAARRLQTAGFVDLVDTPEDGLAFRHELMREAVYADLLLRTRREIHGRVVDALLQLNDDRQRVPVEDLAEHARHAGRWQAAAEYARQAAAMALARDANAEAAYFLRSALASVAQWPDDSSRTALTVQLHLALRDPLFRLGRIDEVADHLTQAAALIDDTTDWRARSLFHVQQSHVHSLRGASDAALAECAKALALARQHGDRALAARAQFQQGLELFQRWELRTAAAALEGAWDYVSVNPDDTSHGLQRGLDAATLSYIARAKAELGLFAEAATAVAQLLALAQRRHRAFDSFFAHMAAGHLEEARGAPELAQPQFEQAEAWCRSGDMPLLGLVAASHLGVVMIRSGNIADGLAKLQATHSQIATMGFQGQLAYCLAGLAEAHLLHQDLTAAQTAAEQAMAAAGQRNDAGAQVHALLVLAECQRLRAAGDQDAGARQQAEALAIAERLDLPPLTARCRRWVAATV